MCIRDRLSHVPLFNGLEEDEIARVACGTREINAARGDILFHKGDNSNGFHLIVYGQVKLASVSYTHLHRHLAEHRLDRQQEGHGRRL